MSNPDIEVRKVMRRIDRYAARLNPGLSAVAIVLSTMLLAEVAARLPALYAMVSESNLLSQTASDPSALLPVNGPSAE